MLLDQNKDGKKHLSKRSPMTIISAEERTKIDVLFLEECRKIVDTTKLGLGKPVAINAIDQSIRWTDLQLHTLLGAGSFGQVWLATTSSTGSDGTTCSEGMDDITDSHNDNKQRMLALKVLSKHKLVQSMEQAQRVVAERNIMSSLSSPFIIRLYNTFQDESRLYMVTSLVEGGELESIIPENGLSEHAAKFYAAGILEALTYMHKRHIIHRDVKSQNVLIDNKGYPVLIDMGFGKTHRKCLFYALPFVSDHVLFDTLFPDQAKYVPDKTFTFCGSPMLTAPEIIRYKGHDKGCDHWSWAVLTYQLVTGHYPFYEKGMDEVALYKRICKGSFELDGTMSVHFRQLMVGMLYPDARMRLGSRPSGWRDIFGSPWFGNDGKFDLQKLRDRAMEAPWVPDLSKNYVDTSNFHHDASIEDFVQAEKHQSLSQKHQQMFSSFGDYIDNSL